MNRRISYLFVSLACVGLPGLVVIAGAGEPAYEMSRATVDGGADVAATGGGFTLSGSIGQPDAGELTGAAFELSGGFWLPTPLGDCEEDGDVDLAQDYEQFKACLTGPDGVEPAGQCKCFDVNRDGAVDMVDFAELQTTFTGP